MIDENIAHYHILGKLGAGGMGEVYRATDTRLGRDVALKALPEAFARDAERMARFEREAKVLASLNHPSIASIHGLEESGSKRALVMELVEGPTLAERIKQGAISLDEALPIAKQIAEALEYAHERGIIHRDLKPSNVKVTPNGQVKVLDFGLAKALEGEASGEELQNSPTLTAAATRAGVLLGTAAYMSPEQARGKRVDRRADIWAFGCVLYEMLTGQRTFTGETTSDTLAAVIKSHPEWTSLPASTPPRVRELLRRCSQKDPKHRLQAIGKARIAIETVLSGAAEEVAPIAAVVRPRWRLGLTAALAAIGAALATGLFFWNLRPRPSPKPLTRFALTLPVGESLDLVVYPAVAISPDGSALAYVARRGETRQLYLRPMDRFEATPLPGTQDASSPFFSPDGQWVGFFADGKLKKTSLRGGLPVTLCDAAVNRGGSWGPDDTIVFSPNAVAGLMRVPAAGGVPQVLTTPDASKGERTHRWPEILPGGKAVVFTIGSLESPSYYLDAKIAVQSLETGERKILSVAGTFARYEPDGHLVFGQAGGLFAVPFDLKRLQVTEAPMPALNGAAVAMYPETGAEYFSFSRTGSLVYVQGAASYDDLILAWVNRKGVVEPLPAPARSYMTPHLSPDGKRVAISARATRNLEVLVYDIPRGTLTRLTYGGDDENPLWSPDGRYIAYQSERNRMSTIVSKAADGSGAEETLVNAQNYSQFPESWSPDSKFLAYTVDDPVSQRDIWILPLEGERKPRPFLRTPFNEFSPRFSPDGHWLAYVSNESGSEEVYVQAFPGPGGKWQISAEGGTSPVWARSGRELIYLNGNKIMGVAIIPHSSFVASTPRLLVDNSMAASSPFAGNGDMDVNPDGQRFLVVKAREEKMGLAEVRVVLNWAEELKRLALAGKQP